MKSICRYYFLRIFAICIRFAFDAHIVNADISPIRLSSIAKAEYVRQEVDECYKVYQTPCYTIHVQTYRHTFSRSALANVPQASTMLLHRFFVALEGVGVTETPVNGFATAEVDVEGAAVAETPVTRVVVVGGSIVALVYISNAAVHEQIRDSRC